MTSTVRHMLAPVRVDPENTKSRPTATKGASQPAPASIPPPLTANDTRLAGRLISKPPPPDYLLDGILTKRTVGTILAVGGTGKTFFLLQLAHALASGTAFGPFKAMAPTKTLMLCAEDHQEEIDRRLWPLRDRAGSFPCDLHIASVTGKVGPLLVNHNGKLMKSAWYFWLKTTIMAHPGLECLILDPMSRFNGLDENSNEQATAWVATLEGLVAEFGLTILFSHHVPKSRSDGELTQQMARGASALVDGVRWCAALAQITPKVAEKYEIDKPRDYVMMDVVKSNYAARLSEVMYLKRSEGGVLKPVELRSGRLDALVEALVMTLASQGKRMTRREITRGPQGVALRNQLADRLGVLPRNMLERAIDEGLRSGVLEEKETALERGGNPRREVAPTEVPY